MTPAKIPPDEWLELLAGHCSGTLNQADAQRLADALRDDDAARRSYIQYMDLHSSLAWESSSAADTDAIFGRQETKSSQSSGHLNIPRRAMRFFVATRWRVALSVASCFVVLLLSLLAFTPAPLFQLTKKDAPDTGDRVVAARITGGVDARWHETALPLGFGSSLYKGQQVELLEGVAEITFESGAVVTLQGPATYVIDANSRSTLRVGELHAVVPKRAKGFSVQTPASLVVDLGTEFGVIVKPAQDKNTAPIEEIHVFKGMVEVSLRQSPMRPRRMTANMAVRVTDAARMQTLATTRREQFPQPVSDEGDTTTGDALPESKHPPVTRGLALWLAADGAVRLGANNTVDVWEDMLTGDNTKAQNGAPLRTENQPRLIPGAINGRPAIHFDGDDFLVLATPSDLGILDGAYEMFIVARTSSPAIQFLIAGGVGDYEIHLNGDAGARFIPAGDHKPSDFSDLQTSTAFSDGQAHLFAARVTQDLDHRGVLQVDGQETTDLTVGDARSTNNTSLRLGMRYDGGYPLNGEIAEVLIYRGQLTNEQRRLVGRFLANKYSVRSGY